MPDIITTLKTTTNQDNVYPNIKTNNIPDSGVTTQKIADNAVTTNKILDNAVTSNKIPNGAITELKLANYCVDENNIINGAVSERCLDNEVVTTSKIGPGAVTHAKLANNSVYGDTIYSDNRTLWSLYEDDAEEDFSAFIDMLRTLCTRTSPHTKVKCVSFFYNDEHGSFSLFYPSYDDNFETITIMGVSIDENNITSNQAMLGYCHIEWIVD